MKREEVRIRVGREGKPAYVAQGTSHLARVPDGPDDKRPPRQSRHRLLRAKKLAQRWIKCQAFMSSFATCPNADVPMQVSILFSPHEAR